jgi:hypothetical protein
MHLRKLLNGFVLALSLVASAAAQSGIPASRAQALQRWEQLSPAQREALRSRFEAWQGLGADRKAQLRQRFERLRAAEQRVDGASAPKLRGQLESATPRERAALMLRARARVEGDKLERSLAELGRRLELPESERDALAKLDRPEQRRKLLELRRREITGRIEREGLPAWITPQEWQTWSRLDDREFFRELNERRSARRPAPRER